MGKNRSVFIFEFCVTVFAGVRYGGAEAAESEKQDSRGNQQEDIQFGIKRQFAAEDFLFGQVTPEVDVLHLELFSHHQGIGVVSETVKRGGSLFYESFSHGSTIPFDKIAVCATVVLYQKPRILSILRDRNNLVGIEGKFKIFRKIFTIYIFTQ